MPLSTELEDRFIMQANLHSESEYADQIIDAFDFLYAEAQAKKGAAACWRFRYTRGCSGQPHRIGKLEQVLEHISGHDGVWSAGAGDIVAHWKE